MWDFDGQIDRKIVQQAEVVQLMVHEDVFPMEKLDEGSLTAPAPQRGDHEVSSIVGSSFLVRKAGCGFSQNDGDLTQQSSSYKRLTLLLPSDCGAPFAK